MSISLKAGGEKQGVDNDTAIIECRSPDAGIIIAECSHCSTTERHRRQCLRVDSVGLLPAPQSLYGLGWLSVAEHVLAFADLCPSSMVALSTLSGQGPALCLLCAAIVFSTHCVSCVFVEEL
jgi:hypothetical protein